MADRVANPRTADWPAGGWAARRAYHYDRLVTYLLSSQRLPNHGTHLQSLSHLRLIGVENPRKVILHCPS
jgi:hypothetical protein